MTTLYEVRAHLDYEGYRSEGMYQTRKEAIGRAWAVAGGKGVWHRIEVVERVVGDPKGEEPVAWELPSPDEE